jgi:uncharacterized damage-inducible protein DinB
MSEIARIIDQLSRAYEGEPWHGPALKEILAGVSPQMAAEQPLKNVHNIWEMVLHVLAWVRLSRMALDGQPMPSGFPHEQDWPPMQKADQAAWSSLLKLLDHEFKSLIERTANFPEMDLTVVVPGRKYDYYFLLHGIVQHTIYHAGQISLLKAALRKDGRD